MVHMDTILFDMDGTLIDTEGYYNRCWVQAIREAGFSFTNERALELRSLGRPFACDWFLREFGAQADYQAIRSRRKELMNELMKREGLRLMPGANELLETVKASGLRAVIATATDLERTEQYLSELGIAHYFDQLICATMVKQGKPAPDIYLYACSQANRRPEACVAVEDSPNGVRSAAAAGCRVIMVPNQSQPDEELNRLIWKKADSLSVLHQWILDGTLFDCQRSGSVPKVCAGRIG